MIAAVLASLAMLAAPLPASMPQGVRTSFFDKMQGKAFSRWFMQIGGIASETYRFRREGDSALYVSSLQRPNRPARESICRFTPDRPGLQDENKARGIVSHNVDIYERGLVIWGFRTVQDGVVTDDGRRLLYLDSAGQLNNVSAGMGWQTTAAAPARAADSMMGREMRGVRDRILKDIAKYLGAKIGTAQMSGSGCP